MFGASAQNKNINSSSKNMLDYWYTRKQFGCKSTFTMKNIKYFSTEYSLLSEKNTVLFEVSQTSPACPSII
jgi:hypothetical protein